MAIDTSTRLTVNPELAEWVEGMSVSDLAWYLFTVLNQHAKDLYPDAGYSYEQCREWARQMKEIRQIAKERGILLGSHYYMRPEIQIVSDFVGDSLALGLKAKELLGQGINGVWLSAVRFMGDTMKIVVGDKLKVYMPKFSGCSLVASLRSVPFDYQIHPEAETSLKLLEPWTREHPAAEWLRKNPGGIVLSYMNSDPEAKALSWAVYTSRNALKVHEEAMRQNPGSRVLSLPDQYLVNFVLERAEATHNPWIKRELVDVFPGLCHVHAQKIDPLAIDEALERYPDAALAVHPECGCSVQCMVRVARGIIQRPTLIGSTQEMIDFAKRPDIPDEIIVATEAGHVFTLRHQVSWKKFYPVTAKAMCEFMKATTLDDLYQAITATSWDPYEVVLPPDIIVGAWSAIQRMLSTK